MVRSTRQTRSSASADGVGSATARRSTRKSTTTTIPPLTATSLAQRRQGGRRAVHQTSDSDVGSMPPPPTTLRRRGGPASIGTGKKSVSARSVGKSSISRHSSAGSVASSLASYFSHFQGSQPGDLEALARLILELIDAEGGSIGTTTIQLRLKTMEEDKGLHDLLHWAEHGSHESKTSDGRKVVMLPSRAAVQLLLARGLIRSQQASLVITTLGQTSLRKVMGRNPNHEKEMYTRDDTVSSVASSRRSSRGALRSRGAAGADTGSSSRSMRMLDNTNYRLLYALKAHAIDDHRNSRTQVWSTAFRGHSDPHLVATCGGPIVCFFDCSLGHLLKRYQSPDHEDDFYTLAWTGLPTGSSSGASGGSGSAGVTSVLAVAGKTRGITLINYEQNMSFDCLDNDKETYALAFSPTSPHLLISGGIDGRIRMWYVRLEDFTSTQRSCLIKVFDAHRADVNTLSFRPDGLMFMSGGSDHDCYLWPATPPHGPHSAGNHPVTSKSYVSKFAGVHKNTIDNVLWITNDVVATRAAAECDIVVWKPGQWRTLSKQQIARQCPDLVGDKETLESRWSEQCIMGTYYYGYEDSIEYFQRFAIAPTRGALITGNEKGVVEIYDLHQLVSHGESTGPGVYNENVPPVRQLHHDLATGRVLRQVAISPNSKFIVAVGSENSIYIWGI